MHVAELNQAAIEEVMGLRYNHWSAFNPAERIDDAFEVLGRTRQLLVNASYFFNLQEAHGFWQAFFSHGRGMTTPSRGDHPSYVITKACVLAVREWKTVYETTRG